MHDIGNVINRVNRTNGSRYGVSYLDKWECRRLMCNNYYCYRLSRDDTAFPVNAIAAAVILADNIDVRRSRVRNSDTIAFDIHDRVIYAVESSKVVLDMVAKTVTLRLTINTDICSVIDYFEIFLNRMLLCRKSADVLGLHFKLNVNGQDLI